MDVDCMLCCELYIVFKQVNYDYECFQYNIVVLVMMKMFNVLEGVKDVGVDVCCEGLGLLLCVLYLVVLYIMYVLWMELGYVGVYGDLFDVLWLQVDEGVLVQSEIEFVLQVNGKVCGSIVVFVDVDCVVIEVIVVKDEVVQKFVEGKLFKKIIVVLGCLVNVVV